MFMIWYVYDEKSCKKKVQIVSPFTDSNLKVHPEWVENTDGH